MKKFLALAAFLAALAPSTSIATAELQTWCEGFADRQGVPRAPCACIVAAIGANAELSAEMMRKTSISNYHETKSQALAAAVDPCVPPPRA